MNLPEVLESHEQERRSVTAFRKVMEDGNFIVRDVRESDYGVDVSVEIKLERKYASNFLMCVQIKDKLDSHKIKSVEGEEYTFPVNLKNVNYLSNQTNSIIAIYLEDKATFVWEWIFEIEKQLLIKKIDLNNPRQQTYNYKFNKLLNDESKMAIHEQIKLVSERLKKYGKFAVEVEAEMDTYIKKALSVLKIDDLSIIKTVARKIEEAEKLRANNKLKAALKKYTNISNFLEDENLYLICAHLCLELHDYSKAIRNFKKVTMNSKNFETYLGIGYAYQCLKEYSKAIEFYLHALRIKDRKELHINLGILYFRNGDIGSATKCLYEFLKKEKRDSKEYTYAQVILAEIYMSTLSLTQAKFFINQILKVNPKHSDANALLGEFYEILDNRDDALHYYQQCLDIDITNSRALMGLSFIYFNDPNIEKGTIYLVHYIRNHLSNKLLELSVGSSLVILHLGWNSTSVVVISKTESGQLLVNLNDGIEFPLDLTNEEGFIVIGTKFYRNKGYIVPIVGKKYKKNKDFAEAISNIEKSIDLIREISWNKQSIDVNNCTKLYLEEENERVYIRIDYGTYSVTGFTNAQSNKKGFKDFVRAYNRYHFFQVEYACEETNESLFYTVNGNVELKNIEEKLI